MKSNRQSKEFSRICPSLSLADLIHIWPLVEEVGPMCDVSE